MGELTNQPMFPVDFLRPTKVSFDLVGSGVDGGVNGAGQSSSLETSGGGMWAATYGDMMLEGPDERFEALSWLGARLNGGFRNIVVPLVNDKVGAFPIIGGAVRPIVKGIPHSDGSLFDDGSGYSQSTVYGEMRASASVGAGVVTMRVYGAGRKMFRWSDFFSIYHSTKGWRLYRSWELRSQTDEENPVSTIAISPPLRQALAVGDRVEFARPRCVMKLQKGATVPWDYSGFYSSRPTISLVEAF